MSEQDGRQATAIQRPPTTDPGAWKAFWQAQSQPWRTEPEIDEERQRCLDERRSIKPDWKQGIFPYKDIKLSRADVEWLLATHENGCGPIDRSDDGQQQREGLDLRGANLRRAKLSGLPLARMRGGLTPEELFGATKEQRNMAATMRPHRTPTVFSNRLRVPKSQRTRQLHATEFLASQMERAREFPNPTIPLREPGRVVAAGSYYRSRCGNWRFSHSCTE